MPDPERSASAGPDSIPSAPASKPIRPFDLLHADALVAHLRQSLSSDDPSPEPGRDPRPGGPVSTGSSPGPGNDPKNRNTAGSFTPVHALAETKSRTREAGANSTGKARSKPIGTKARLKNEESGIVRRRDGSVLVRGCMLKTDNFPNGRALDLDFHLDGAPNFRAPTDESLNVYGVAQPTLPGLRSILSVLGCRPIVREGEVALRRRASAQGFDGGSLVEEREGGKCVWFCTREEPIIYISGRPFVLRDSANPRTTLALADRAETLEQIEVRLKRDVLRESRKYGGVVLTHDEQADGEIQAMWCAVDEENVLTIREAWSKFQDEGWAVEYHRTPISSDRPIEDNYLDSYLDVLRNVDPLSTSLVFNDGLGAVRATFAMIAALLVRRKQLLLRDMDEPFSQSGSGFNTPAPGLHAMQFLKQAAQQQVQNRSLLRLSAVLNEVLEQASDSKTAAMATELLVANSQLLESLRSAHMGEFTIVLSLISAIDNGRAIKDRVDRLIDSCDQVLNLRNIIVEYRMRYAVSSADEKTRVVWLDRAVQALERYFFLIAFASYLEDEDAGTTGKRFADWLAGRPEIYTQIQALRRRGGGRLFVFGPISDLTALSRIATLGKPAKKQESQPEASEEASAYNVVQDEFSAYVIAQRSGIVLRTGTLLKNDQWRAASASSEAVEIKGAHGFRRIPQSPVYALGQPSEDAILHVLQHVAAADPSVKKILWLNLREEPVVMIVGEPYCLRKATMSLRNLQDYSGMSGSRLEILEDRLVSDVTSELRAFDGKLLLHNETEGLVIPAWDDVRPAEVKSLKAVMAEANRGLDAELVYRRLPITAQSTLDFADAQEMLSLCVRNDMEHTAVILVDQLGRGRSSTASVIFILVLQWIRRSQEMARSALMRTPHLAPRKASTTSSWQVVNSCLRVLRWNGIEVKRVVDEAVDQCGQAFNCRERIEQSYRAAESESDPDKKKLLIKDGKVLLNRYLQLIQFQAYLMDLSPDEDSAQQTFAKWYNSQPVFKTFEAEMKAGGLESLLPLQGSDSMDARLATDEADRLVMRRNGSVLSAGTIIKSDLFMGLQKQSLPDRVEGAANYRKVSLVLGEAGGSTNEPAENVYGTGMPTDQGLRNALVKMDAGPGGHRNVLWTSLREEPVLYICGKPHVLRLFDEPIVNIETTGVSATVVEGIERNFKSDVLREISESERGRLLLHDEMETQPGQYDIVPIWQDVKPEEVLTPKELFDQVIAEGYNLRYTRIAVTDEQAPLPESLTAIIERVEDGLKDPRTDFVFNCQMGRGRTTTGMVASSIIATIEKVSEVDPERIGSVGIGADGVGVGGSSAVDETVGSGFMASRMNVAGREMDEVTEERAFLNGEYRMILHLVSVLTHGREAKRIADRAIDAAGAVQNLREAIYDFKLKMDACDPKSIHKYRELQKRGINYAYRYAMLIVLTAYLLEAKIVGKGVKTGSGGDQQGRPTFSDWLREKREIRTVLSRQTLD